MLNVGQLPIASGYAGAMGGTRVYVYGPLHRSGFCGKVKGIYLSSDDTAHMRNNTENFCVGLFCRWESKVKIWFADGLVLWQYRSHHKLPSTIFVDSFIH